jgi:hypothetical protein
MPKSATCMTIHDRLTSETHYIAAIRSWLPWLCCVDG